MCFRASPVLVVFFCFSISVSEDTVLLLNYGVYKMKCLRALLKTAKMNLYLNKAAAGFSHVALWVNVAKPAVDLTQSERRANPRDQHCRSQLQPVYSDSCLSLHHIFGKVSET